MKLKLMVMITMGCFSLVIVSSEKKPITYKTLTKIEKFEKALEKSIPYGAASALIPTVLGILHPVVKEELKNKNYRKLMTRGLVTYGGLFVPFTAAYTWKFLVTNAFEKITTLKDVRKD